MTDSPYSKQTDGADASLMVRIRDLSFRRGGNVLFENLSMDIPRGRITAVMGPSGCGKTTLLRLMTGQLLPDSGSVYVDERNVPQLPHRLLMKLRQRMGMLFQNGALLTDLSVYENVAFPLRENTDLPEDLIRIIALMKLESVGLRGVADYMPAQLSGGMSRRVALARTIAMDPMLILYDEPFTGQDPISMGYLARLIHRFNDNEHITSIIVSHDVHETCAIADDIYLLANGGIVAHGTPDQLQQSDDLWVQQFLQAGLAGPASFHHPAPDLADALYRPGK